MKHALYQSDRGAQMAEAALVLPLVFLFMLGIFWFGRAYSIYATLTHAAREGNRLSTQPLCATCGNTVATADSVADRVSAALLAAHLDPTLVTSQPASMCACSNQSCGGSYVACESVSGGKAQVCIQDNVALYSYPGAVAPCGNMVSLQYPFQVHLPFTSFNLEKINIRTQVQMQGNN